MSEDEILSIIKRISNENGYACLESIRDHINIPNLERNLNSMVRDGSLERDIGLEHMWYGLTPQGYNRLNEIAESRTQKKRDKVFDVFLLLLGSAITLAIEHFAAIAEFISGLFRNQ